MTLDRIHITNLEVQGIIGINPEEQEHPQTVRVNATFWVDTSPAAASDDIADAANYRTVTKAMIAHIEQGRPFLVERLVQELADLCFEIEPRIAELEMTVEKPGALRFAESVGITIHRVRVDDGRTHDSQGQ
ncbi:MAG TPA: dihydroneopterin aldolase [Acidimicrobiia bacterium]|jgi:FolB domain-containing protein|nr:dihydroneopterin aldolase [Acidimicrobiia bacterium]